jgi:hypothetical protein
VKVKSELVFDSSGTIESITPLAICLEVPGNFVMNGFNKEIAWFDLQQFPQTGSSEVESMLDLIKGHNFYGELLDYSPLVKQ